MEFFDEYLSAEISDILYKELLIDRTTRENIRWATEIYSDNGPSFYPQETIRQDLITGRFKAIIQPRIFKSKEEQNHRTKDKAEVFTPSWVCNEQNNLVDDGWFGRKNVFNSTFDKSWKATEKPLEFPKGKSWQKYVDLRRMEMSCGEAPYLVSRYDTVSGKEIPIPERIGLLDRKLRVINENVDDEEGWNEQVLRAYQSTYGFEYQGDNLLIARFNLLLTFIEYTRFKFGHDPKAVALKNIARVISWNIWQMDGLNYCVPFSERPRVNQQISLFEILDEEEEQPMTEPVPCKIKDWRANQAIEFRSMIRGGRQA